MDLLEAMQERRSTRGFLHKPVEREPLERLLSLATQAPSANRVRSGRVPLSDVVKWRE